jgi:ABC-type antimicrobial peptide transport system permease subunit
MSELVDRALSPRRVSLWMIGSFAGLVVLLSAIGIYGVVSYTTEQRSKEFGLRIALGARRSDLVVSVLKQGLLLTGMGAVLGIAAASFAARALSQMLFGVGPLDVLSFATGVLALMVVSVGACVFPAWRVSRLDPVGVLRTE